MVVEDMVQRSDLQMWRLHGVGSRNYPKRRTYDFIIGRAVTALPTFFGWVSNKIRKGARNSPANGILYLKGGDYTRRIKKLRTPSGQGMELGRIPSPSRARGEILNPL